MTERRSLRRLCVMKICVLLIDWVKIYVLLIDWVKICVLLIDWVNLRSRSLKISLKGSYFVNHISRGSLKKIFRYVLKCLRRICG